MHSYFVSLYIIECASQHYNRTLENISIWDITVVSEHVYKEIALEPSCESSDTNTFDSQIVDKPCDELELVHSSSPTVEVQIVMTGEIHEVQGNEHNSRDSGEEYIGG